MPIVSVILTSYNHEKYLAQSIDSIVSQTIKDIEILIIDDNSSDGSWNIIESYKDKRIRAFRNKVNIRSGVTFNAIKNIASGKYIAIHHSDDIWEEDKLEKQIEILERHNEYSACFTNVELIDEFGNQFDPPEGNFYKGLFEKENRSRFEWLNYFFNHGNCLCHPSILIRKEAYEEYGLFNYGFGQIPDFLMWIRLCMKSEIYIIQEKLTKFRLRNNELNTSGDKAESRIRASTEYYMMLREFEKINRDDFIKVFPDAVKYVVNNEIVPEYALAMICIDQNRPTSYNLFGVELLFKMVNNPTTAELIKRLYGFSYMSLIQITGKLDIFCAIPEKLYQKSTLYIDIGNGFSEKLSLKWSAYLPSSGEFTCQFNLGEISEIIGNHANIKALRFDPYEGFFTQCVIKSFKVNDVNFTPIPYNSVGNIEGVDTFLTPDPIYLINNGDFSGDTVAVSGNIRVLESNEIEREISYIAEFKGKLENEMSSILEFKGKLEDEMSNILEINNKLHNEISNISEEKDKLRKDIIEHFEKNITMQEALNSARIESDRLKSELYAVHGNLDDVKSQLKFANMQLDNVSNELYNTQQELSIIYNSKTWKLLNKVKSTYIRIKNKLK